MTSALRLAQISVYSQTIQLFIIVDNPISAAETLSSDLNRKELSKPRLVKLNSARTKSLLITRKKLEPIQPSIHKDNHAFSDVDFHKHLGLVFSCDYTWYKHIDNVKELELDIYHAET